MGKPKKPEMSPRLRARCNELYVLLKQRTFTKEELSRYFEANERTVREMVSLIAKKRPVITTSDQKGYRVAVSKDDLADAEHAWAELDSRIAELEQRKAPLIRFCEWCKENNLEETV